MWSASFKSEVMWKKGLMNRLQKHLQVLGKAIPSQQCPQNNQPSSKIKA